MNEDEYVVETPQSIINNKETKNKSTFQFSIKKYYIHKLYRSGMRYNFTTTIMHLFANYYN